MQRLNGLPEYLGEGFPGVRLDGHDARGEDGAHVAEEGRPIETVWDVVTGATAYAKSIPWTAERVEFETVAGDLLDAWSAPGDNIFAIKSTLWLSR